MKTVVFILFLVALTACNKEIKKSDVKEERYNFLFITNEDISPYLSFYGDSTAYTPNLDKLAKSSLIFDNAFTPVGVCSPSRSCIATGMFPISIGTHNMRTGQDYTGWGNRKYEDIGLVDPAGNKVIQYSVVVPPEVKVFTQFLREVGYYCTNRFKTDMQFATPMTAFDENSPTAHYKNREFGKPFFSIFNSLTTHESKIWVYAKDSLRIDPDKVKLPAYFSDDPIVRTDVARNYSNIELFDAEVGKLLNELEEDGLLDKTIIFYFSDHGGPLPRGKRTIYDSGLRAPFMIRFPKGMNKGRTDRLISFADIAPTVLSLAGIKPPDYMQGVAFAGKYEGKENKYVYGSRDRFDEIYDRVRSIRNKNYLLVKNYFTKTPRYIDIAYRKKMPMMRQLLKLRDEKKLNREQMLWFETPIPEYELYDVKADPEQLHNLSGDLTYDKVVKNMAHDLDEWLNKIGDKGETPEGELLRQMWPDLKQPVTQTPKIKLQLNRYNIKTFTKGSDLVYKIDTIKTKLKERDHWKLYKEPIVVQKDKYLHVRSVRIGYSDSEEVIIEM